MSTAQATLVAVRTAYLENADYASVESLAKAQDFATACRRLLLLLPQHTGEAGFETDFDPAVLQAEAREAERWIATYRAASGSGSVNHFSFRNFR
jgi:hypothetical protein